MSKCIRCNKTFKYNHSLVKHLNKKYPCLETEIKQNEYLYVIHTREFINQNIPIYKVGRSRQVLASDGNTKRLEQYPKGSLQLALFTVRDCIAAEAHMKNQLIFCHDLKHRRDYGLEYFEGSLNTILSNILVTLELFTATLTKHHVPLKKLQCTYCYEEFCRNDYLKSHIKTCKEKNDAVRCLEINLNIDLKKTNSKHECRFCNKIYTQNSNLTRHIKTCKAKQEYREKLEVQVAKTLPFQRLSQK